MIGKTNTIGKTGILVFVAVAVVILGVGVGLFGQPGPSAPEAAAVGVESTPAGASDIRIPLPEISGKAKFYSYESNGVSVRFFVVKASDGSIKAAFDACDVCYRSRKGYRQEGDYMVCNNCGNRYPISGLGTENRNPGGCWPGYLPSEIDGNSLLIKSSDLEKGRYRFA